HGNPAAVTGTGAGSRSSSAGSNEAPLGTTHAYGAPREEISRQMKRVVRSRGAVAWFVVLVSLPAATAGAQAPCTELENPVIGAGGSASVPLLERVGAALRTVDPPITLVYQSPGACFGITPYVDGTRITGTASYWD